MGRPGPADRRGGRAAGARAGRAVPAGQAAEPRRGGRVRRARAESARPGPVPAAPGVRRRRGVIVDRAIGALTGLAIGDALGMPTQALSRGAIAARYGRRPGSRPGPPDQPIAPGLPAGTVTDDTEQALLLARLLVEGDGHVEPRVFADALLAWEADMVRRGSADLLGPSTKKALALMESGVPPEDAGRGGTTNGAAMRVTP